VILSGVNAGDNAFAPIISSGNALTKSGNGAWTVTANNDYTGVTTVSAGTLIVNSIPNAGVPSPIGAAYNGASDLVLTGGTLRYTGAAGSTNRLFSLNGNAAIDASG